MKRNIACLLFVVGFFLGMAAVARPVLAECSGTDYDCQITELQKEYDSRIGAHEKNKTDLEGFQKQIASIVKKLTDLNTKIKQNEKDIYQREVDLGVQQVILSERIREMYKRGREVTFLTILLSSRSVDDLTQGLAIRRIAAREDWNLITSLSGKITALTKDKANLKASKVGMANLKAQVDKQAAFLQAEVAKTEKFFTQIKQKQNALLALKAGGFSTSVGDVSPADDPASRPDYNPGFSPAFAVFSFGAPHRKGMSQYGALGRAKSGQSAEEILKAYYGNVRIEKRDLPATIATTVGTMAFEDKYLRGIAEMPAAWADQGGFEALKAQAVAARTYAMVSGRPICITEACQVYSSSKNDERWNRAVAETRGMVIVSNASGNMILAMYAAASGGYTNSYTASGHSTPGLWDTKSGRGGWTSEAYEKIANCPWFYKAWYRLRSGGSYGRSHPWLNQEEFSDILNALLIYKGDSGATAHLSSLDAGIGDTWSVSQVREESKRFGGPVTKISGSPDVVYANDGYTATIYFETNIGRKEFSGDDFKYMYNLRAPGAIGVKSALFNIMRK